MRKLTCNSPVNQTQPGVAGLGLRSCARTFQKPQVAPTAMSSQASLGSSALCEYPRSPRSRSVACVLFLNIFFFFCSYLMFTHKVRTMNDDLNTSLATADELSKEFSSLLSEVSSKNEPSTQVQFGCSPPPILNPVQKCTRFF